MFLDPHEENTCGWSHWERNQDGGGIIPKNQVTTSTWVLKSKKFINDQVLDKILYTSMSMGSTRLEMYMDWICECKRWRIEGFFSCGSTNRLEGSGARNLAALGVGWDEQLLHFCFPNVGAKFIFYVLNVCRICLSPRFEED